MTPNYKFNFTEGCLAINENNTLDVVLYYTGGRNSGVYTNATILYYIDRQRFEMKEEVLAPYGIALHVCEYVDGRLFVIGGISGIDSYDNKLRNIQYYDTQWNILENEYLEHPTIWHRSVKDSNNNIYIIGGSIYNDVDNVYGPTNKVYVLNPYTLKLNVTFPSLNIVRSLHTSVYDISTDTIFVFGGQTYEYYRLSNINSINDQSNETTFECSNVINSFGLTIGLVITIFVIITVAGTIDSIKIRKNDIFHPFALVPPLLYLLDQLSDIFLSIQIYCYAYSQNRIFIILFVCSILFIIIPGILSLYQMHTNIKSKWIDHKYIGNIIKIYILQYSKMLYFFSIITGSAFTGINICNSNIFGLKCFDMRLPKHEQIYFNQQRIYSMILLENIPQIIIQIIFTISISKPDFITIMSFIFSFISIISSIFSYFTYQSISSNNNYIVIQFNISSNEIVSKYKSISQQTRKLKTEISKTLSIETLTIDVLKPAPTNQGINQTILVNIPPTNANNTTISEYETKMFDSIKSGNLSSKIVKCWNLTNIPRVHQLDVVLYTESHLKRYESHPI